jgi:UrcA family protein
MLKLSLAACAAVLALSGPALADDAARAPTAVVLPVGPVDFSNSAAVTAFYAELQQAAHAACDSRLADRDARDADAACARAAADAAVARLARPILTAMHQTRSATALARGYN